MRIAVRQGSFTEGNETLLVNASNTNVALPADVGSLFQRSSPVG